jgi:outer membrane receptor protein involved in Fe transport
MKKIVRIIMVMLTVFWSVGLMAQGTIKGTITLKNGKPVAGATVLLKGTTTGTTSDFNGKYSLQVPAGKNILRISYTGFKPIEYSYSVNNGATVSKNFVLHEDLLSLDQVVVTGVQNNKTKLQSSVAITTISAKQITEVAPRGTADLLKSVPGFYVESSGGKGNANVFARGLPSSGGLRYVQLQEDGMPVFEYGDLMFGNTDIMVRVDQTTARMEAVRGGSASILTSNAPGGIINFISKTGGPTTKGTLIQYIGLTYMHSRTGFDIGGPISKNIRYNIGGFYRADDGIRSPGYTANNGGQIKANVTYLFKKGYFRLRTKLLNDRNIAYLPFPMMGDPATSIPGFDAHYGTMKSLDLMRLHATTPSGTEVNENLADGMHPQIFSFGGEGFFDLGNNWSLKDNFQKSYINLQFNSIFGITDPQSASSYATGLGLTNYHYAFADGYQAGQPISDMSSLNGNGLVANYGWWAVNLPLEEFGNDFKITKKMKNNTLTAGWYFSTNKVSSKWWWHNMLVDISGNNTRKLNLVNDVTGESLTTDGYSQYGTLFRDYYALTRINAMYLFDEWDIGKLTINAGLRLDMGRTYGYTEKVKDYTYDVNGDGIISPAETNVQYGSGAYIPFHYSYDALSWSLGLNYEFNKNMAIFARASNGHRAPADRSYAFGGNETTSNGFPADTRVESIDQYELGFKYNTSKLALFATGFYSYFSHIAFTDFVLVDGKLTAIQQFYNTSAAGLELEAVAQFGNLNLSLTGTYQNAVYHDWVYHDASGKLYDFDGHFIQRLPKLYFTFRPSYQVGKLNISVTWQYFGKRFTNPANKQVLPQFSQINARLDFAVSKHISVAASGNNLFNAIGLTEGNPRSGLTSVNSQYFYARSILGRSAVLSFQYKF